MSNTWWLWMIGVIGIAACGDNAPAAEQAPPGVVVRTDAASVGDCPYGGTVVLAGLDGNRDGVLDASEVQTRSVFCNAPPVQPPPPILVRLIDEPAGAHCALGGTAVQSGPDRNGNGQLDDDEVEHTDYVCGERLLTRLAAEPPGANCVAGGVAFLLGRDRDGDGQLDDDEVEQTEFECGDELARDVSLRSPDDVAALANIAIIAGSLSVEAPGLGELTLPRLVQVRGALELKNADALVKISLPALQTIDGRLSLERDARLATIELPQLHRVGSLVIQGAAALHDLSGLPALADVTGSVQISDNDALVSADLPLSEVHGDLAIDRNAQLAKLSWALIGPLGSIQVTANPQLGTFDLAQRDSFDGAAFGSVTISSNDRLTEISLNVPRFDAIHLEANRALAAVTLAPGQIAGDVALRNNGPLALTISGTTLSGPPTVIGGSLTLAGPVEALHSALGLVVNGDCTVDSTGLASLDLGSSLIEVHGALHVIDNARLAAVSRVLVGRDVEVRGNPALATLAFLAQDVIGGSLVVADNAALAAAPSLEALTWIRGDVRIASNPMLKIAFGPALARIDGDLSLDDNERLVALGLTKLARVRSLAVTRAASLPEIDLPALIEVASGIEVRENAALLALHAPVLRRADLGVFDNPRLPACDVAALFAVLLGDHQQSGNDDAAVCGP